MVGGMRGLIEEIAELGLGGVRNVMYSLFRAWSFAH